MRSYAKHSPRFWTGSLGKSLRGDAVSLALGPYLIGGPHSNMIGLYHLPVPYIVADTGLDEAAIDGALDRLSMPHCIPHPMGGLGSFLRRDRETDHIWVVEHARHELGETMKANDTKVVTVKKLLREHDNSFLYSEFLALYSVAYHLQDLPILHTLSDTPADTPPDGSLARDQQQQQEQEGIGTPNGVPQGDAKRRPSPYPADFEEFWQSYPRKTNKGTAARAWKARKAERPPLPEVIDGLERCKKSRDWLKNGGEFIPHPATWLNAHGWLNGGEPSAAERAAKDFDWSKFKGPNQPVAP